MDRLLFTLLAALGLSATASAGAIWEEGLHPRDCPRSAGDRGGDRAAAPALGALAAAVTIALLRKKKRK